MGLTFLKRCEKARETISLTMSLNMRPASRAATLSRLARKDLAPRRRTPGKRGYLNRLRSFES